MKKYLLVLIIMLLVVTGCGEKKLTCTLEEDGQKATVTAKFGKDDIVTDVTMNMSMPFEKELTAEEKEQMESYMGIVCAAFDYEGITCDTKMKDKSVDVVVEMNMAKMDAETKEEMGYTDAEGTYDAMKKGMEESGYTCK